MLLEGNGQGSFAPVYARAARLEIQRGRPTLASDLLVEVMHRMRRGEEALDIALVTDDPAIALNLPLPRGLNPVAIIAERSTDTADPFLPIVGGIVDATSRIANDDLVIVDSERGRVWVNPTAEQIAALQAETFRPRILVDQASTPAETRSGRIIKVWAEVSSSWEAEAAVQEGADGLLLTGDGPLGTELMLSDDFVATLAPLTESIGGGDIALHLPPDSLDITGLVRFATHCRLRLLLDPKNLPAALLDLRQELADAVEAAADEDIRAQVPEISAFTDEPDYSLSEFADVFAPLSPDWTDPALLYGLPPVHLWAPNATIEMLTAQFTPEDPEEEPRLPPIAGFVVAPEVVLPLKEFIRTCE